MSDFLRVTKDNPKRDRGFISIDAICAAFENQEAGHTDIMTMDGYWYEVLDDIDKLYSIVESRRNESVNFRTMQERKKKRMMVPTVREKVFPERHEDVVSRNRKSFCKKGFKFRNVDNFKSEVEFCDLPSGDGKGHYDMNPKVEKPPIGEGL